MNADQLVVFDARSRQIVANLDGFKRVHSVWAVPELGRVYASVTGRPPGGRRGRQVAQDAARVGPVTYPDGLAYAPGPSASSSPTRAERRMPSSMHDRTPSSRRSTRWRGGEHRLRSRLPTDTRRGPRPPGAGRDRPRQRDDQGAISVARLTRTPWRQPRCRAPARFSLRRGESHAGRLRPGHEEGSRNALGRRGPDVLAFDPGLGLLYVAAESGRVAVFREQDRKLVSEGLLTMPHAHTVCVDPRRISCTSLSRTSPGIPSCASWSPHADSPPREASVLAREGPSQLHRSPGRPRARGDRWGGVGDGCLHPCSETRKRSLPGVIVQRSLAFMPRFWMVESY